MAFFIWQRAAYYVSVPVRGNGFESKTKVAAVKTDLLGFRPR